MTDLTAFERILNRVSTGETIIESVLAELGRWQDYYSATTREQRKLITQERRKHPHRPNCKPAQSGAVGFYLTIPDERMIRAKAKCKAQGISMRRYINSLIVTDLTA